MSHHEFLNKRHFIELTGPLNRHKCDVDKFSNRRNKNRHNKDNKKRIQHNKRLRNFNWVAQFKVMAIFMEDVFENVFCY